MILQFIQKIWNEYKPFCVWNDGIQQERKRFRQWTQQREFRHHNKSSQYPYYKEKISECVRKSLYEGECILKMNKSLDERRTAYFDRHY